MTISTNPGATRAPERKAVDSIPAKPAGNAQQVAEAFDDFMIAFESFKQANDERLRQIEQSVGEDPVTADKVDRINQAVDEQKRVLDAIIARNSRPGLGVKSAAGFGRALEHKDAFATYVRSGDERQLRSLEAKAMRIGSGPDGGFLVPDETEAAIGARLANLSPVRAISSVRQVSAAMLKKPFSTRGPAVGWVGETDSRDQTDASVLAELEFPTMELYAMPAATTALLEDSAIDIDQWLASEVEAAFAEQEGTAFVTGDGDKKPRGFMHYDQVAESGWSWGNLGYVVTGEAGALSTLTPADVLIDVIYALKAGYRQNANWVMNRRTQAAVRKVKDEDGNYIWQPPAASGESALLNGFAIVEAEDMPDIEADKCAIAFGDFRRGYLVVDRTGVTVLRDPYSAKPYVLFYTTKRVGGGVQDFDAIKLIKFGTA